MDVDIGILVLYYLCSFAGLIMVGGGIWLIYKQKIYIDRESNQITEIETPIGKFRTNIPALALFILGFIPLIYPIYVTRHLIHLKNVAIYGSVRANVYPVLVHAVIKSDPLQQEGRFVFNLPVIDAKFGVYKIIYVAGNILMEDMVEIHKAKGGEIHLSAKDLNISMKKYESTIQLREIPSEFR
jgi:hypothetical protein